MWNYCKVINRQSIMLHCSINNGVHSLVSASAKTDKLDVKLTEEEVAKILELILTFSSKWDMIGLKIGFTFSELENIKSMPFLLATAPTSFLKELLSQWVQWPTLRHPTHPTLRVLCTSLRSSLVGLGSLADKVEREITQSITGKGSSHG